MVEKICGKGEFLDLVKYFTVVQENCQDVSLEINTLQFVSETSLSSQSLALVLTT